MNTVVTNKSFLSGDIKLKIICFQIQAKSYIVYIPGAIHEVVDSLKVATDHTEPRLAPFLHI